MIAADTTFRAILDCVRCGAETTASSQVWSCPTCGGPLSWRGPTSFTRSDMAEDVPSLWRYDAVLPIGRNQAVSLGESITPLVEVDIDGVTLRFKLDFLLPTGSYKDRGAAVLLSALKLLGVHHAVEDSSGNAAAAIAAYSARAGIACTVFAPAAASAGKTAASPIFSPEIS